MKKNIDPPHKNYYLPQEIINFSEPDLSLFGPLSSFIIGEVPKQKSVKKINEYYFANNLFFGENLINNKEYMYKLNKNFYRTSNFINFEKQNFNVLTSGCSFTFGTGLPEELIWPTIIKKNIEKLTIDNIKLKSENVKLFNLAQSGASTHYIINQIMLFIKKFGKPNLIIILFPEISRDIIYEDQSQQVINILLREEFLTKTSNEKKYILNYVHENNILKNYTLISLFENYCKESNIKFLWSCTLKEDFDVYKKLKFNYISKEFINFEDYYKDKSSCYLNEDLIPYWGLAADQQHPGTCYHKILAKSFEEQLNEIY